MRVATALLLLLLALGGVLVGLGVAGYGQIWHEYNPEEIYKIPALQYLGSAVIVIAGFGFYFLWVVSRIGRD